MINPEDDFYYQDGELPPEHPEEQPAYSGEEEPADLSALYENAPFIQPEDDEIAFQIPLEYKPTLERTPEEASPDFDFSRMEDDMAAFHRELDALRFAEQIVPGPTQALDEEPTADSNPAPRRRRRTINLGEAFIASNLGERLQSITQRTSPNVDFFIFSLLCGLILGIGYLLDAPAILVIGIFIAPLLGPLVGAALSAITGDTSLFRLTFGGVLISLTLVFAFGALAGFAARFFPTQVFSQAFLHARLWWPEMLMLVLGTAVMVISFIQTDERPIIPSLMVAYEIFLPVSAAGFGLGSNISGLWPQAGLVFLIHLALVLIITLVIFFFMGFRPLQNSGYALTAGIVLIGVIILGGFAGFGSLVNVRGDQAYATALAAPIATQPTPTIETTPSQARTEIISSQTPAPVIAVPTIQPTGTLTPTASLTPPPPEATVTGPVIIPTLVTPASTNITPLATLVPTPVYGRVQSTQSDGVLIRIKPGGESVSTVQNGYLAQIMGDKPVVLNGLTWIHVIITTPRGDIDGWVIRDLIVTATPSFSP